MPLKKHSLRRIALQFGLGCILFVVTTRCGAAIPGTDPFARGSQEFVAGHFAQAAELFRAAAAAAPSTGAWHNVGVAEWKAGNPGPAILAWERAQWLDPFNRNTASNLRYARRARQLDAPELAWHEICSTWLPVNWWPWLACFSFWLAISLMMLPGIFGWRKAGWQQGLAAACFAIFLLTIPALLGVHARAEFGVILPPDTPLRLTPTKDAQVLAKLPAGESARLERARGSYLYIRTPTSSGWVGKSQFALVSTSDAVAP